MKPAYVPNPGDLVVITQLQEADALSNLPEVGSIVVASRYYENRWVPFRCRGMAYGSDASYPVRANDGSWCMLFANDLDDDPCDTGDLNGVCRCRPADPAVEAAWRLKAR